MFLPILTKTLFSKSLLIWLFIFSDYEMLKTLLSSPPETRQGLMDVLFPPAPPPVPPPQEESLETLLSRLRSQTAPQDDQTDSTFDNTATNQEEGASTSSALQVLNLLSNLKESEFGELIFDKEGCKIWFTPMGTNMRYTINKELQIDANVFNSEIYLHSKRKFPKAGGRVSDAVSIRANLLPAFEFIVGHASEKLQPSLLGKNITPAMLALAQKLIQK